MAKESRLRFEDAEKKPPSKLSHTVKTAPLTTVSEAAHRKIDDSEDENHRQQTRINRQRSASERTEQTNQNQTDD